MSTPEYERWAALAVSTPADVRTEAGGPVPLSWQMSKLQEHSDRLALPVDFAYDAEWGTAEDALAGLALRTSLLRDLEAQGGSRIHEAALLGAAIAWATVRRPLVAADEKEQARPECTVRCGITAPPLEPAHEEPENPGTS
ncbi:hypothetical protein [Streptomyces sp. Ncost-T10-10d]|uniref:hypothetical protein n=1 Tax=Streptomyces sp. Ncost-T10-10d TaxID=1839774 RepID=UPI00081E9069|nr:hypothetical protein [Streptomyces sp. Ncost-T10-10d]SCF91049.1 hypothetical protein GA0115254_124342 [Streptomyces sp. Ncost-T10-10d]